MLHYISSLPSPEWENTFPRTVALLGSTGSIGTNALQVIAALPELFQIQALAARQNIHLLAQQAIRWRPPYLAVLTQTLKEQLKELLPAEYHPQILIGNEGYKTLASLPEITTVLSAQVGAAGLGPTLAAAKAGKVICLANKESLVLAGEMIRAACLDSGAVILPVDSEHNALFQALQGRAPETVRTLILTASGGPFRGKDLSFLSHVTPEQALRHPTWRMGAKITIDSSTMMNKGLEVIEAHALYALPPERIDVVVHPQSAVHSLVEFTDGSLIAQLGTPDMRLPLAHCLAWPRSANVGIPPLNLARVGCLTFEAPDLHSFPCLALAQRVLAEKGALPVVLNAANEVAVEAFLSGRIGFMDIPAYIAKALDANSAPAPTSLEEIEDVDRETRHRVGFWIKNAWNCC